MKIFFLSASRITLGQHSIAYQFQLYFTVALITTLVMIGAYMIIFRKDEKKRTQTIAGIPYAIAAMAIIILMVPLASGTHQIAEELNTTITHDMDDSVYNSYEELEEQTEDMNFAEKSFIAIIDSITSALVELRGYLYSEDMSIQKTLFEDSGKILVNLNVNWRNQEINLYTLILGCAYLLLVIAIGRAAITTLKIAYNENEATELRDKVMELMILPALIILAPGFIRILWLMSSTFMRALGDIDFSLLTTPQYSVFDEGFTGMKYGLSASVARIMMFFIEFKIWFILMTRKAMLNGFYVVIPLALTANVMGKEFDSFNMLLRQLIKFTFLPFFYALAYIIVLLLVRGTPNGGNVMVQIVFYMIMFKLADALAAIFMLVSRGQDRPSGIGSMGGAGMAMAGITMVMGLARGGGKGSIKGGQGGGGNGGAKQPTLFQTISKSNTASMASNQFTKAATNVANKVGSNARPMFTAMRGIGQGAKHTASAIGAGINTVKESGAGMAGIGMAKDVNTLLKNKTVQGALKGGAMIGVGLLATAATGNPLAGGMAAKGAGGLTNTMLPTIPVATSDHKNHPRR